jgi:laccase
MKPYRTDVIMIDPGQTVDILLTANRAPSQYYLAARAYSSSLAPFDNTTTTAILTHDSNTPTLQSSPFLPSLPLYNDRTIVTEFTISLRSLDFFEHPIKVPQTIDENIITTDGVTLGKRRGTVGRDRWRGELMSQAATPEVLTPHGTHHEGS